ncbi:DUF2278 family protein [Streptomyces sp. NPDC006529]|uniref:DUF2278 family protein n=1 Tax=Streptomyces sp. NPDC006529 TaxID=3157177 RepID=UPI0033AAA874
MPLENYGVLSGTLHRHVRDDPDAQGRWSRVHLEIDTPAGRHTCAIDVDGGQRGAGVQWKVLTLYPSVLEPVDAPAPGYHDLSRARGSGALDYLRHPALGVRAGRLFGRRVPGWLRGPLDRLRPPRPWTSGSCREASQALEALLVPGRPVLVFGEPSQEGLGLRRVHQNQGDPLGTRWWAENGTWQDGALLVRRPDGRFDAFLSRFSTQADATDPDGHPLPEPN